MRSGSGLSSMTGSVTATVPVPVPVMGRVTVVVTVTVESVMVAVAVAARSSVGGISDSAWLAADVFLLPFNVGDDCVVDCIVDCIFLVEITRDICTNLETCKKLSNFDD